MDHDRDYELKVFELLLKDWNEENNRDAGRNNVYLTLNLAGAAALAGIAKDAPHYLRSILIGGGILGAIISICWLRVLIVSKRYAHIRKLDVVAYLTQHPDLEAIFQAVTGRRHPARYGAMSSVSFVGKAVAGLSVALWLSLAIYTTLS